MIKEIYLDNTPCTLKVVLQTHKHEKLWIKLANADQKKHFFTPNGTQKWMGCKRFTYAYHKPRRSGC